MHRFWKLLEKRKKYKHAILKTESKDKKKKYEHIIHIISRIDQQIKKKKYQMKKISEEEIKMDSEIEKERKKFLRE